MNQAEHLLQNAIDLINVPVSPMGRLTNCRADIEGATTAWGRLKAIGAFIVEAESFYGIQSQEFTDILHEWMREARAMTTVVVGDD